VLFLGILQGSEEVALYKIAYQMASLIPFGLMAVNTAIAPALSKLYTLRNFSKFQKIVTVATIASFAIALPLTLLFTIGSQWFIKLVFGYDYLPSSIPLIIIAVGQTINVATGPVGLILMMTGYEKELTLCLVISYSLNILLNIIFIPIFSVTGASLSLALSTILVNVLGIALMYKHLRILPISISWRIK